MSGGVVAWRCTSKGITGGAEVTTDRLRMEDYAAAGRKIEPLVLQSDLDAAIAQAEAAERDAQAWLGEAVLGRGCGPREE